MGSESPLPHHSIEPLVLTNEISAKILEHALWMQREGYRPATIEAAVKTLKAVGRRCNILRPEEIKGFLVKANYGENRKDKVLGDLTRFYKFLHGHGHRLSLNVN